MSVTGAVQLTANLDLSPRHLANLVDFRTLSADDGTDQLWGQMRSNNKHNEEEGLVILVTVLASVANLAPCLFSIRSMHYKSEYYVHFAVRQQTWTLSACVFCCTCGYDAAKSFFQISLSASRSFGNYMWFWTCQRSDVSTIDCTAEQAACDIFQ